MIQNELFYQELSILRDLFHKKGGFDDSNSKLDELTKILAIYVYQLKSHISDQFNLKSLLKAHDVSNIEAPVNEMFRQVAEAPYFRNVDGSSIFGNNPRLNIPPGHADFLHSMIKIVINSVDKLSNDGQTYRFDVLNEAFGHFVRDNFRNNIEDAQYMTPSEVVDLMCKMALNDLSSSQKKKLSVCDPCCGVGSFLSSFYLEYITHVGPKSHKLKVIGQDKVGRMVRFAKINMLLADNVDAHISVGNSLVGNSLLDQFAGEIDLILTNPPFAAKFDSFELAKNSDKYSLFAEDFAQQDVTYPSELLFLDRCLKLLKADGRLLAVVPDSVISSGGLNSLLRKKINDCSTVSVKAVIELPAVTFAQAGTRTKTCVLYLQKNSAKKKTPSVFFAKSEHIGFEVSTKKGATIKYKDGISDIPMISEAYQVYSKLNDVNEDHILSTAPSCVAVDSKELLQSAWTPSRFHSTKLTALRSYSNPIEKEFELVKLSDLVTFDKRKRSTISEASNSKCISVLHIYNRDQLDLEELMVYNPKYPGFVCRSGDLIYSKINPRILRILVIPELPMNLTCSTEFQIMNSTGPISNYGIKLLLMHPKVQLQINNFTSGTSSSHNRIKSEDLANVLLPIPKQNTRVHELFCQQIEEYENEAKNSSKLAFDLLQKRFAFFDLLSATAGLVQAQSVNAEPL